MNHTEKRELARQFEGAMLRGPAGGEVARIPVWRGRPKGANWGSTLSSI